MGVTLRSVGRKPQGYSVRTVGLPPELWARLDRYKEVEGLSSVAEALRVLLWRVFREMDAQEPRDE
jgi:hypothetical protein